MGWLQSLLGRRANSAAGPLELDGPGEYLMPVVGESNYQRALESICGGKTEEGHERRIEALLVYEDHNPHDNQAIRVDIEGSTVRYLSRKMARDYKKEMATGRFKGRPATCPALIVGGWYRGVDDQGHFGVRLDIGTMT